MRVFVIRGLGAFPNRTIPSRYKTIAKPIMTQMPMKISLFKKCHCSTRSALDKNFTASPNSKNPKTTFTEFSQPPDFGKDCNQPGKSANKAKGKPSPTPKPAIPKLNCVAPPPPPLETPASKEPRMGPVQENDTMAKVSAMKKMPQIS